MFVGPRPSRGQATRHRGWPNAFYNRFSSWMVGHRIEDLTSGFRAVRRRQFMEFLHLLPNAFSYPTTCTMAFFRAGYSVAYEPIDVLQREAGTQSHGAPPPTRSKPDYHQELDFHTAASTRGGLASRSIQYS